MKKGKLSKTLPLLLMLAITGSIVFAQEKSLYSAAIMRGISNEGKNLDKPYLTPGDRTYIVGTQDGNFPDLGSHVKGEMGGLWMQPIKLLDGFWVNLSDENSGLKGWLMEAKEFINYPYGNEFIYEPVLNGIRVQRLQYCPQGSEGMVIKYTIQNTSSQSRRLTMDFVVKTDVSPVWYSKENNILDAADTVSWDEAQSCFVAKDINHPWFAVWGTSLPAVSHTTQIDGPIKTIGKGKSVATKHLINLKPNEIKTVVFVVSGSNESSEKAKAIFTNITNTFETLLKEKQDYYAAIMNRAVIEIPDKKLQQAYTWGKFNTEWLVSDLPGIGRFLGAGAVEYPWLFGCDNSYALQGVVASGNLELAKSTLRTIKNVSEKTNGNGQIIHEMSSNGFVGNKGNTQETAHFAVAVWKIFQWTGDVKFLKEMYPYIKLGLSWLLTVQDKNGNMFPEGYGIMEVKGLDAELIDVAVYTQQAFDVASKMAAIFKEPSNQKSFSQKALILKNKINTLFWDEKDNSYADFYGSREQALSTAHGSIDQIQMGVEEGKYSRQLLEKKNFYEGLIKEFSKLPKGIKKGWFTNKNWVISTPMETGIAPRAKAYKLLNKVRNEHCGEYGPYLSAVEKRSMMTIATGVQAMAECAYGRTDQAMWYVDKIVQTFSRVLPGSISEMMPDYGCPVQAWTIYGLASPLVTHVFGISPDAYNKTIVITPHLPSGWDNISISNLPVGNNELSFVVNKIVKGIRYNISSKETDWKFKLKLKGLKGAKYILNGKTKMAIADEITLKGKENIVVVML